MLFKQDKFNVITSEDELKLKKMKSKLNIP